MPAHQHEVFPLVPDPAAPAHHGPRPRTSGPDWWRQAVVHQVRPRGFADCAGASATWVRSDHGVPHFAPDGGRHSVTDLTGRPVALPDGEVPLSGSPRTGGRLPADTTVRPRRT
jgi:hypothetical protein